MPDNSPASTDFSWSDLSGLDPARVAGLLTEQATAARTAPYASESQRVPAVFGSIHDALTAAAGGAAPETPRESIPTWLDEAIAWRLEDPTAASLSDASDIRALERLGLTRPRRDASYALMMMRLPADWNGAGERLGPGDARLVTAMVQRLWDLTAVRGGGPKSHAKRWQRHLVDALSDEPRLRTALLRASLRTAPWDQEASWLRTLFEAAEPTAEERAEHQDPTPESGSHEFERQVDHHSHPHREHPYVLNDVAVEPADLAGLLLEHGERVTSKTYAERWERDNALYWAAMTAVDEAVAGRMPAERSVARISWLRGTILNRLRDRSLVDRDRQDFAAVRVLERAGLLELEADEVYVSAMIMALATSWTYELGDRPDPAAWFAGDPELVDRALWRVFDLPGYGTISLTNIDGYANGVWERAFLTMTETGVLDRRRLLLACLTTLASDWPAFRLRWFVGLLTNLAPTPDEVDEHQAAYRRVLRSPNSVAVRVALDSLQASSERGRLEDDATLQALIPVLTSRPKANALRAVALVAQIHARGLDRAPAEALAEALNHPDADVQQAAATLLGHWGETAAPPIEPTTDPFPLPPAVFDAAVPVQPVGDHDLPDRLAAALENPDDPIELELVLDRLARTTDAQVLAPLLPRARKILRSEENTYGGPLPGQIARLIVSAAGGQTAITWPAEPIARFLVRRLLEVEQVLVGAAPPGALTATPDDGAGWVDPARLVRQLGRPDHVRRPGDLVAALLRLHPDGRATALAAVSPTDDLSRALRHALGAPLPDVIGDPDLWVAAARARDPLAPDPALIAAGLTGAGQGRPLIASTEVAQERRDRWETEDSWRLSVKIDHPCRRPRDLQPTAMTKPSDDWYDLAGPWPSWSATVWPHDAEHFLVSAAPAVLVSVLWGPGHPQTAFYRALARHPGRLGPLAATTVGLALSGGAAEDRIHAADLFIDVTGRGRLTTEALADAMAAVVEPCVLTRWAESLSAAANGGAGRAVVELLTSLLPRVPKAKTGLHALVNLLHSEQLRLGGPITDRGLRDYLATITGSSKAARTARAILAR